MAKDDKVKPRGIGLKQSEWEDIEKLAAKLGVKPHALTQYAIRYFLKHYHEGRIELKTETRKTYTLPDL